MDRGRNFPPHLALAQVFLFQNIGWDPLLVLRYALIKPQVLVITFIFGEIRWPSGLSSRFWLLPELPPHTHCFLLGSTFFGNRCWLLITEPDFKIVRWAALITFFCLFLFLASVKNNFTLSLAFDRILLPYSMSV